MEWIIQEDLYMFYNRLFKKKLSINEGEKLLTEYCKENGFDDHTTQWKEPTHNKHWYAYSKRSYKMISKNWICYHLIRGNEKYSIWIDLVTEEIREVLRPST
jgi:hypothetical protein